MTGTTPKLNSTSEPLPCPQCGRPAEVHHGYAWSICCEHCYDFAPDESEHSLVAWSYSSRASCIDDWNEMVTDRLADREEAADVAG